MRMKLVVHLGILYLTLQLESCVVWSWWINHNWIILLLPYLRLVILLQGVMNLVWQLEMLVED